MRRTVRKNVKRRTKVDFRFPDTSSSEERAVKGVGYLLYLKRYKGFPFILHKMENRWVVREFFTGRPVCPPEGGRTQKEAIKKAVEMIERAGGVRSLVHTMRGVAEGRARMKMYNGQVEDLKKILG